MAKKNGNSEEKVSEFLNHSLKGMQECAGMTEEQRKELFSHAVYDYYSDRMPITTLLIMSIIFLGESEGEKRFRKAVPFKARKSAALRAREMGKVDDNTKKMVIKAYLGKDAKKILAVA